MRLVIDCFKLVKGTGKSIGIYNVAKNIVENIVATEKAKSNEIIVLGNKHNRQDFDIPGVKFMEVHYNPANKIMCILWELFIVPRFAKKLKADSILFPRGFMPLSILMGKIKSYIIIHDMIPFYYHKNHYGVLNPVENFYIMWRLKASARSCSKVITVSEASKDEIAEIAKVDKKKIEVIYSGCNGIDMKAVTEACKNVELKKPYISAITSKLPHKNAIAVIESYKAYYEKADKPMDIAIIGLENANEYSVSKEIGEHIHCYKFLPKDEDMHAVIAGSQMFMFLSKKEGFGFPPVEAMQLSVPVISSGESSLKEIVSDAAIVVAPDDYDEVSNKLIELQNDDDLSQKLIEKGISNANRFNWINAVNKYADILFE